MEYAPEKTAAYLAGSIDKFVKQPARDTIMQNVKADRFARYARIPDGKACDFCLMLGSRGFVYHSKDKAGGDNLHGSKLDTFHAYCNCQIAVAFDPKMQFYYKGWVKVSRGYSDSKRVVSTGRDKSFIPRDIDIDELFAEYEKAGKSYTSGSRYRDFATGRKVAKLTNAKFSEFQDMLEAATTIEELEAADKYIVANWNPGGGIRDEKQWAQMSGIAKRRKAVIEDNLPGKKVAAGIAADIDPELRAWAKQFPEEELRVRCANGESFYKKGDSTSVEPTKKEMALFKNGEAKHTHTTPIGGTFGSEDVWFTVKTWVSKHTVDDIFHDESFQLVRTTKATKKSARNLAKDYEKMSNNTFDELLGQIYDANGGDKAHGFGATVEEKIEAEKALKPIQHKWLGENAEKYGYEYLSLGNIENRFTDHVRLKMDERAVSLEAVIDADTEPLHRTPIIVDEFGRPSYKQIGKDATIVVNPETNSIISVWRTGKRDRRRYESNGNRGIVG